MGPGDLLPVGDAVGAGEPLPMRGVSEEEEVDLSSFGPWDGPQVGSLDVPRGRSPTRW
jgi:hypothetical protein